VHSEVLPDASDSGRAVFELSASFTPGSEFQISTSRALFPICGGCFELFISRERDLPFLHQLRFLGTRTDLVVNVDQKDHVGTGS